MNQWCTQCCAPFLSNHIAVRNCSKCGAARNSPGFCSLGLHKWNYGWWQPEKCKYDFRGCVRCGRMEWRFWSHWQLCTDPVLPEDLIWPFTDSKE